MLIDGKSIKNSDTFDVVNPYTGKCVARVSQSTDEQIEEALHLSYNVKPKLLAEQRECILGKIADRIMKEKDALAKMITSETGLCIQDTLHEVDRVSSVAVYAAKVAGAIERDTTEQYIWDQENLFPKLSVVTEPFDLAVAITPFNHPMNQVAHKIFPAIAAGTCMVLKPSPKTPLSALKLGEIVHQCGLEKNMLNIVTGTNDVEMVRRMVSFPRVDMVTFTGGLEAGLSIQQMMVEAGNGLKKYIPELGGCSSLIIHCDADLLKAAKVIVKGCFQNSGQRCTAIRRIIVLEEVADKLVNHVLQAIKRIKWGDPFDVHTQMGSLISEDAAKKVEKRVENAIKNGAQLLYGHKRQGALYSPTLLDRVPIRSELVAKETFGPVAPVLRVKHLEEAIQLANQTEYGLAGAVMTASKSVAWQVANALKVGQFNWNGVPSYRSELAPFGGFGSSGNGEKEGVILASHGMRRIRTFYQHPIL